MRLNVEKSEEQRVFIIHIYIYICTWPEFSQNQYNENNLPRDAAVTSGRGKKKMFFFQLFARTFRSEQQ